MRATTKAMGNACVAAVMRPTANLDEYIASNVAPRFADKDKGEAERAKLCAAKYYAFGPTTTPVPPPPPILAAMEKKKQQQLQQPQEQQQKSNDENTAAASASAPAAPAAASAAPAAAAATAVPTRTWCDHLPIIDVVPCDCLKHAQNLFKTTKYQRVGVLNAANEFNCGGAFSVHNGSQEEYLFRNSTLPLTLWPHRRADQDGFRAWTVGTKLLGPPSQQSGQWYKFTPHAVVISPYVEVFAVEDKVLPEAERFTVSVITNAAQDLRPFKTQSGGAMGGYDKDLNLQKIRAIFFAAADAGIDALVLTAHGSGAFLNDPHAMASLFQQVISEYADAYSKSGETFPFKKIDFAIIKSADNLKAYKSAFGK